MKIRALHPKKNFLNFLVLSLLVIGGSVGVVLATQKNTFDESQAAIVCTQVGFKTCINNSLYVCAGSSQPYYYKFVQDCSSVESGFCRIGGKSPSDPAQCATTVSSWTCNSPYSCLNRLDCVNNGGKVVSGKCGNTGKICCRTK